MALDARKARLAQLYARHAVKLAEEILTGQYRSSYAGNGLDFAELGNYQQGDARHIHWPASLRKGTLLYKKYEEDREMPVVFAVDTSLSTRIFKSSHYAVLEIVTLLSACALQLQEECSLLLSSAEKEFFFPSQRGVHQVEAFASAILNFSKGKNTDLRRLFHSLLNWRGNRGRFFVISDWFGEPCTQELQQLSSRHQVTVCHLLHCMPSIFEDSKLLVEDAENGTFAQWKPAFHHVSQNSVRSRVVKCGAEYMPIVSGRSVFPQLLAHFRNRKHPVS